MPEWTIDVVEEKTVPLVIGMARTISSSCFAEG